VSFFKKFIRKKKEEAKVATPQEIKKTELEEICGDDKEVYEALKNTMYLDPRWVKKSIEEVISEAEKFEKSKKSGDLTTAKMWYEIAGGLAIWKGDVEKVKQCFGKCQELSPNEKYKILEIPERAVAKAREYYQKYLKEEEKK